MPNSRSHLARLLNVWSAFMQSVGTEPDMDDEAVWVDLPDGCRVTVNLPCNIKASVVLTRRDRWQTALLTGARSWDAVLRAVDEIEDGAHGISRDAEPMPGELAEATTDLSALADLYAGAVSVKGISWVDRQTGMMGHQLIADFGSAHLYDASSWAAIGDEARLRRSMKRMVGNVLRIYRQDVERERTPQAA